MTQRKRRKKTRKTRRPAREPAAKNRAKATTLSRQKEPEPVVEHGRQTQMNYRWVNENLRLEYEAKVGNGHTAQLASSTQVQGADVIFEDLGLGGRWQGRQLNLTARVRREQAAAPPLVSVIVWQSDPTGIVPGRINEQAINVNGDFDANGFADLDVVVTFD